MSSNNIAIVEFHDESYSSLVRNSEIDDCKNRESSEEKHEEHYFLKELLEGTDSDDGLENDKILTMENDKSQKRESFTNEQKQSSMSSIVSHLKTGMGEKRVSISNDVRQNIREEFNGFPRLSADYYTGTGNTVIGEENFLHLDDYFTIKDGKQGWICIKCKNFNYDSYLVK